MWSNISGWWGIRVTSCLIDCEQGPFSFLWWPLSLLASVPHPPVHLLPTNRKIFLQWESILSSDLKLCSCYSHGFGINHMVLHITNTLISSLASALPPKPCFVRTEMWILSQEMLPWSWPDIGSPLWAHGTHDFTNIGPDTLVVYDTCITVSVIPRELCKTCSFL